MEMSLDKGSQNIPLVEFDCLFALVAKLQWYFKMLIVFLCLLNNDSWVGMFSSIFTGGLCP